MDSEVHGNATNLLVQSVQFREVFLVGNGSLERGGDTATTS
jgi:hypothetical protein